MEDTQVAVLGSGIAGTIVACLLADRGYRVSLLDRHEQPMSAASRWNEGKIHLGFTYVGTPSLATARLMIGGAAAFEKILGQVCGSVPPDGWYTDKVVYLVDPDSQFPAELLLARSRAVDDCLAQAATASPSLARYAGGGQKLRVLDAGTAARLTGVDRIEAAWETTERAIAPGPVAVLLRDSVRGRDLACLRAEIQSVQRAGGRWRVSTDMGEVRADAVVNCSWQSRALLDRPLWPDPAPVSIRFKYALFGSGLPVRTPLVPSTRILGRYGDITPYGNGDLYLSWYPAGLAGLSDSGEPPTALPANAKQLIADTLAGLGLEAGILQQPQADWQVRGGFVVARGCGDIDHAGSPLHERSQPGAREIAPGYVSVDTGKYSLGPLFAEHAATLVEAHLGAATRGQAR